MKILQLKHLNHTKTKKFLRFPDRKLQILKKMELLLVLCLATGGFSTVTNASATSVSEKHDETATKPKMKKSEKLKKTFRYLIKHYKYRGSPIFIHSSHWEINYALSCDLSGVAGRPNYKKARKYVVKI